MSSSGWFLLFAFVGAACTVLALWPPRRPAWLGPMVFFSAWLTSELAPWIIVVQVLGTLVFVALGALGSWPGFVALAITLASWCGLAGMVVASARTGDRFAAAFAEDLGADWRDPVARAGIDRRLLLPGPSARRGGIERIRNVPYAGDDFRRHQLDVWRSKDVGPGAPVLLQIHGGGWMTGNKDQQARPLLYHFAQQGWVCVAINYRLAPKAKWPDQLVDCKLALRWIREHVHEYGGDPEFVVATGGSAGGHLTALVGLTANRPEYQPGFESVDTSVRAIVPLYGVYDFLDRHGFRHGGDSFPKFAQKKIIQAPPGEEVAMFAQASPLDQIHPGSPPALIVHGTNDVLAPVEEARLFAAELRAQSDQPVVYVELPGAHHAFDLFHSARGLHVVAGIDDFLSRLLRHEGRVERP